MFFLIAYIFPASKKNPVIALAFSIHVYCASRLYLKGHLVCNLQLRVYLVEIQTFKKNEVQSCRKSGQTQFHGNLLETEENTAQGCQQDLHLVIVFK